MVDLIDKILKYVPTKARAQAAGFGFQKLQAGPKAASGQVQGPAWLGFFWPGLAWLLASGQSQHITTIDPRNWGDAFLSHDEVDVDTQAALFDAFEKGRAYTKTNIEKPKDTFLEYGNEEGFKIPVVTRQQSIKPQDLSSKRAGSRPAAQIVPDSSLGVALGKLAQIEDQPDPDDPDDNSDYPDDTSYDTSSYSRTSRSYSRSRSRSKRRRRRRRSKQRSKMRTRHHGKSTKKSGTTIKPIAPKDYDGAADARAYHRFVMEGEAYIRDGKVSWERQIRILAHYLDGKAYDFYMQKVASDNPNNWTLYKFFTELFNYCFLVDY